jgi:RNA polymerase-binding transcription factor DksA
MSPKFASNGSSRTGFDRYERSLREWAGRLREPLNDSRDLAFLRNRELDFALLLEIDNALSRLANGTYGVCLECGERIQTRRLNSAPWTKFCRRCQDVLSAMAAHTRGESS